MKRGKTITKVLNSRRLNAEIWKKTFDHRQRKAFDGSTMRLLIDYLVL